MENSIFIKIPGADCGELKVGELFCFLESGLYSQAMFTRSEFASSVGQYVTRDQQRAVQYIDANENIPDYLIYDETIRSKADMVIVDFHGHLGLQALGQYCGDLKAIAKQFRVRVLVSAKIQEKASAHSMKGLSPEIHEAADILLLETFENSKRMISIVKCRS